MDIHHDPPKDPVAKVSDLLVDPIHDDEGVPSPDSLSPSENHGHAHHIQSPGDPFSLLHDAGAFGHPDHHHELSESSDSNDFVRVDHHVHDPQQNVHHQHGFGERGSHDVITPSDDVRKPFGDDLGDFGSPGDGLTASAQDEFKTEYGRHHGATGRHVTYDLRESPAAESPVYDDHEQPDEDLDSARSQEPLRDMVEDEEGDGWGSSSRSRPLQAPIVDPYPSQPLLDFGSDAGHGEYGAPAANLSAGHDLGSFQPSPPAVVRPATPPAAQPPKDFGHKQAAVIQKKDTSSASACMVRDIFAMVKSQMDPRVLDLIYWRDVRKSGVVFGGTLVLLLCMCFFSVISVCAYLGLLILTVTLNYRIYKSAFAAVQKTDEGNPFKPYLEHEVKIPQEKVHEQVDHVLNHAREMLHHLRRLFLCEDIVDSLKFGVLLWSLTYIGAWFSGLGLLILALILVFTLPKVYETYKEQIDTYYKIAHDNVTRIVDQVKEKLPFLKQKPKTQ